MRVTDDNGIKRIEHRGYKIADNIEFWKEIDTLYEEGYRFSDPINIAHSPTFYPVAMVEFEKKESGIVQTLNKKIEKLESEIESLRNQTVQVVEVEEVVKIPETTNKTSEINLLSEVSVLTKKKPLIDFAEEHDIEVPDNLVAPSAIKKYIKETLEGK